MKQIHVCCTFFGYSLVFDVKSNDNICFYDEKQSLIMFLMSFYGQLCKSFHRNNDFKIAFELH